VNYNLKKMIMNMKSLGKMREIMDTCYKGQENSVVEFWKHKVVDSTAVRDFYSLLRVAILGDKSMGHLKMLIDELTLPCIMEDVGNKQVHLGEREGGSGIQEDLVEQRWKDVLNVAVAEPTERSSVMPIHRRRSAIPRRRVVP
jgi:hypothetical protein